MPIKVTRRQKAKRNHQGAAPLPPMPADWSPMIEIRNTISTYEALIVCRDGDVECGLLWSQIGKVLADLPSAFDHLRRSVWQAKCEHAKALTR